MSARLFTPRYADLPRTVPVFPLPGALLLPGGQLPLNIFEPRYLAMTLDALGQGRVIAMVQPRDDSDPPALYSVACLGRITTFSETDDGRLLITLTGMIRLRVGEELPLENGYRRVKADYGPYADDLNPPPKQLSLDRETLFTHLKRVAGEAGLAFNWKTLDSIPDSALVNSLSMVCPFEPREKQGLLEAETLQDRADMLSALLSFGAAQNGGISGGGTRQ